VETGIEPNLFNVTFNALNGAVDAGFGSISYDHPDFDFVNELKHNNAVFSAFKTHRQQNDLAKLLLDENGTLKPFDQFRRDAEPVIGEYNRNWLKTEYDTAVIRARMAARFKQFQRDADLYPNLRWTESTSVVKREPHVKLYGLILPIAHPFWQIQYPGSLWNCKCGITNTDEAPNGKLFNIGDDVPEPPAGLDGNPAFTGKIFSLKHPYVTNAYGGKKLAKIVQDFVNRVMLKYAEQKIDAWKKALPEHNGQTVAADNLVTGNLIILRKTVTTVKEHYGTADKLFYLTSLDENVKSWKYLGWKPTEAGKHGEAEYFNYYRVKIKDESYCAHVKVHRKLKGEVLYCITKRDESGIIKGKPKKK